MPIKSKAQQRMMYATKGGASTGIPKSVANKYIAETPKSAYTRMPKKVALRKKKY